MDIMKYLIVAGVSIIVAVIAGIMGNVLSGVLIFILLFGGYILFNVTKVMKSDTPEVVATQEDNTPNPTATVPPKDN